MGVWASQWGEAGGGEASGKLPRHPRFLPDQPPTVGVWSVDRAVQLGQEFSGREGGGTAGVRPPNSGVSPRLGEVDSCLPGWHLGSSAQGGRAREAVGRTPSRPRRIPQWGPCALLIGAQRLPWGRSSWANTSRDSLSSSQCARNTLTAVRAYLPLKSSRRPARRGARRQRVNLAVDLTTALDAQAQGDPDRSDKRPTVRHQPCAWAHASPPRRAAALPLTATTQAAQHRQINTHHPPHSRRWWSGWGAVSGLRPPSNPPPR